VPVYVYRRRDGSTFETEQRMAEDAHVACPRPGRELSGSSSRLRRATRAPGSTRRTIERQTASGSRPQRRYGARSTDRAHAPIATQRDVRHAGSVTRRSTGGDHLMRRPLPVPPNSGRGRTCRSGGRCPITRTPCRWPARARDRRCLRRLADRPRRPSGFKVNRDDGLTAGDVTVRVGAVWRRDRHTWLLEPG
jgi:hypothetical protein